MIRSFDFPPNYKLSPKYRVVKKIGGGWEGEVYIIRETTTNIERAAKFFLPHRNRHNTAARFYAKKLHKLRNCPILIQYLSQDTIQYRGTRVTYLISEYVEGEPLTDFLERQRGKRISAFQAVHLLHALAKGIEDIHRMKEYHGDIHSGNIIIQRHGLGFELKLLDMFQWGEARPFNIKNDICDSIRIFYDAIGGKDLYARQLREVKSICCGLKRSLILQKFKTSSHLREYLEKMSWD